MGYKLVISEYADELLNNLIYYLIYRLKNEQAAKHLLDGDFFISDWLRNRNTVEFLGIWEQIHNPNFNYDEFAIIRSNAGLNSYKISVKEWTEKTNAICCYF